MKNYCRQCAVFFSSKCTTNRLAARLRPDTQEELTALLQTLN